MSGDPAKPGGDGDTERRSALEDSFFSRPRAELRERLRAAERARTQQMEGLAEVSGIGDPAVLERLTLLDIRGETLAALTLQGMGIDRVAHRQRLVAESESLEWSDSVAGKCANRSSNAWIARFSQARAMKLRGYSCCRGTRVPRIRSRLKTYIPLAAINEAPRSVIASGKSPKTTKPSPMDQMRLA